MTSPSNDTAALAKVFISHASRNHRIADDVRARLEALGIGCWIAPRDIPPGASYGEQITGAIQNCAALVLILTEEANASRAVANELEMAFRHQRVIIPVRLKPIEPASSLAFFVNNAQWVDACQTPLKLRVHEIARIVRAVASGSAPPAPAPEQKTVFGSLERRIEGMVRYKLLTLGVVLALVAALGSGGAVLSGKTLSRLQAEQDLIAADPSTYGLVNLTGASEAAAGKTIQLQATAYLNLKEPTQAGATWRAYWRGPDGSAQAIDVGAIQALRAPGAQRLDVTVPGQARTVVFCLTAKHPSLGEPHTASWAFDVNTAGGTTAIARAAPPRLVPASAQDCAS